MASDRRLPVLRPEPQPGRYVPPYGDLVQLNTHHEVLDAVGREVLETIAEDYMELLGTSSALYETNGDYALGLFSSGWCRFMDAASHRLCGTADVREALASGRWHCHESCWNSSRDSIQNREEVDVECEGGIRLFAVPIVAGDEVVGSLNFGYGDPPRDPDRLAELAEKYRVSAEELRAQADAYASRPPEIVEMAKRRLRSSAKLIGEIVARRRTERALAARNQALQAEVARRERAEAELREVNETLAGLIRAAPLAVIALDLEGTVRSWNPAAERMFGWTEAEVRGRFNPIIPPDRVDEARGLREAAVSRHLETERQRKDGSRIAVSLSTAPLLDSAGRPTGVILLLEDISERQYTEAALRESEHRFRFLADAVPQQIWVTRPDGYHEYYNQRWFDYTGLSLEESRGVGWNAVLHPDDRSRAWDRWRHSLSTGEPYEIEYRFRRHDGAYRWFLGQALPQRDESGEIVRWFGTLTDIHDRRAAEDERDRALVEVETLNLQLQDQATELEQQYEEAQALNGELEATNRELESARAEAETANRSKMEFLSAMSHELRTPLNAIAGYVDLMELGIHGPITDPQRGGLERIKRNQAHLLTLINDILNFARLEAGRVEFQMREEPVHEVLLGLEALVEPQVSARGLAYTYQPCESSLTAWVDRERLQQILLNLVSNAIKFTEPGGWIVLSCEGDSECVHIRVRDSGIGIPAEKLPKIFDPFVQAHRSRNDDSRMGVGLGLAISRDLACAMGGELSAQSREGEGSTFVLTLPRRAPADVAG